SAWQSKSAPVFDGNRCFVNSYMQTLADMEYPVFSGKFADVLATNDKDHDGKIAQSEYGDDKLHTLWGIFDSDHDGKMNETEWGFALASNAAVGGLFAIELGGKGDVTKTNVKWKVDDKRTLSDVTTPVLVGNVLFVISSGSLLTALDPDS